MSTPTTDRGALQQVIRALLAAGVTLDRVYDGEEDIPVKNETEALDAIFAVDLAWLHVNLADGSTGYLFAVLGNSPEEVVADYTLNLDSVIDPVTSGWW